MQLLSRLGALLALTFLFFYTVQAQPCGTGSGSSVPLPTKCFEIESILVNACSSDEGYDEMVRLRIGPNAITLNTINTVSWPTSNTWLGWATFNTTNLNKLTTINNSIATAGNCGRLIKVNPTEQIPAYARLLIITSTQFSATAHDFSTLKDTLYVALQNNNSVVTGHFSNNTNNNIRTLIIGTSTCKDTVRHNGSLMVKADGTPGSEDGSGVSFDYAGNATYYNYGCAVPIAPYTADAGTTLPNYCSGATVNLVGSTSGTACAYWYPANRNTGTCSDSTQLSTTFNINPAYTGNVKLYLRANANCGFVLDSVSFNVSAPTGSINITATTDTVRCNKNTVSLTANTSSANPVTWTTSGKGTWSSNASLTPTYTPSINDTLAVWFAVTQNASCGVAKDSIRIRFTKSPSPLFVPTDSVFCTTEAGRLVALNALQTGGVFSGNEISGNQFVVPATPGTYQVKYVVSANGCSDSLTRNFFVTAPLSPTFGVSDTLVCLGVKNVVFTPLHAGGVFSGVSVVSNVFTPTVPGVFNVKYKLASGQCIDSSSKTIYVSPQPDASFSVSQTTLCLNSGNAVLTPTVSGGIFAGSYVNGNTFTPSAVGPHEVKYIIQALGCTDSSSQTITVLNKPDASFSVADSTLCINQGNLTLVPTNTGGVFYGTGVSGNVFTPTAAGIFPVSYVLNNGTCKDSVVRMIEVFAQPDADFNVADTVLCEGDDPLLLVPVTNGGVFSGGLVNGNEFNPSAAGLYTIKYTLINGACIDSVQKNIRVVAKPTADFTYLPLMPMVNDTIAFTYTGSTVNNYFWQMGDGTKYNSTNPNHPYTKEGKYSVWLLVENNEGCKDSIAKEVSITADFEVFIPNVFTPNFDSVNDRFKIRYNGVSKYKMFIYNRWGSMVYASENIDDGWDGYLDGTACPDGVYVYLAEVTAINGKKYLYRGTVTLIR